MNPAIRDSHKSAININGTTDPGVQRGREQKAQSCDDEMIAVGDAAGEVGAQEDKFLCTPCAEEDVFPLRRPRIPATPSDSEVEEHRKTHIPYRSWCECCVMGRGLGEQRGAHRGREHLIPRI